MTETALESIIKDVKGRLPKHIDPLDLQKEMLPITSVRALGKADMVRNDACPDIEVDPCTFEVRADGCLLMHDPVTRVPLARSHFLR